MGITPPNKYVWEHDYSTFARGERDELEAFIRRVREPLLLESGKARLHVHWIPSDRNDRPLVKRLARALAANAIDFCIPRRRIEEAKAHLARTGSTSKLSLLDQEARRRFTHLLRSGEGGELLLWALLETGLGIPQVLTKMAYKTDNELHVNGADGIHMTSIDDGMAVYWGESKVYDNFQSAATACMSGIAKLLLDEGMGEADEDILLLRDNLDIGEKELSLQLAEFFTLESDKAMQLEVRGACLVGFGHDPYSDPDSPDADALQLIADTVDEWAASLNSRVKSRNIASFELEVFCVPVPSAQGFRDAIEEAVRFS
jgi:hypothetical protein